ncbi:MAG: 1-deoxy-D-xylulose-5-phosphate reductoisomerase [Clostridia bacterium]|nr:1-deoxy-D-xylulose-5-phosphate reductoisomerase [Clostridia bacterium]
MKKIALLGSTGSIGKQVLNIVDRYPQDFKVVSICCNKNAKLLSEQINKYKPMVAGLTTSEYAPQIISLPSQTTLYTGEKAMLHCVLQEADIIVIAVVGFCGLEPLIQACKMGKTIALANKESLISGGEIVMTLAKEHGATIIPVDSEHSAIWQCLHFDKTAPFKKIILTASGGALRSTPIEELEKVTPKIALAHPNWNMGDKITIDCATMMNKGLEVIEAMWLFNCPLDKIHVVIHPQSIIHSMVEYQDNSVIAQLGTPTMELPIQLALTYPERKPTASTPLDFYNLSLDFKKVDLKRYPCFELALKSAKTGHNIPCALSSANEEAVNLFLQGKIKYTRIADYVSYAINNVEILPVTYENLVKTNFLARELVLSAYKEKKFD